MILNVDVNKLDKNSIVKKLEYTFGDLGLNSFPLREVNCLSGDGLTVLLKQEWEEPNSDDPLRSIKRKPAYFLFYELLRKGYLESDTAPDGKKVIVTATSGNLGIELAQIARDQGYRFVAILPAYASDKSKELLMHLGADTVRVGCDEDFCPRETTVFAVRSEADLHRAVAYNLDQYNLASNLVSHIILTGREMLEATDSINRVIIAGGSGGTASGLIALIMALDPDIERIVTQPMGREHSIAGVHILEQPGLPWSPENYIALLPSEVVSVDDIDAYAFTALLWDDGFNVGPSTGMVASHAYKLLREGKKGKVVLISADNNFKYFPMIADVLRRNKDAILERYPKLGLEPIIDSYISYSESQPPLIERVRQVVPQTKMGKDLGSLADFGDFFKELY